MELVFHCSETKKVWEGVYSRKLPANIQGVAKRKLNMMYAATGLNDLRQPPGNQLEALSGDRNGQHSIRINRQWRICFVASLGGFTGIEIVDYH